MTKLESMIYEKKPVEITPQKKSFSLIPQKITSLVMESKTDIIGGKSEDTGQICCHTERFGETGCTQDSFAEDSCGYTLCGSCLRDTCNCK